MIMTDQFHMGILVVMICYYVRVISHEKLLGRNTSSLLYNDSHLLSVLMIRHATCFRLDSALVLKLHVSIHVARVHASQAFVHMCACVCLCVSVHVCVGASVRPSVRPSVWPSVRPSVWPSVRASIRPSVRPSPHVCVHLCVRASVRPRVVRPSIPLSVPACVRACVRPSVRPPVRPSVRPPVRPSVHVCLSMSRVRHTQHACDACLRVKVCLLPFAENVTSYVCFLSFWFIRVTVPVPRVPCSTTEPHMTISQASAMTISSSIVGLV